MSLRVSLAAAVKAYPTLLRIGFAEAIAYRAEMIVWMLSTTMPLVNLALWSAVSASGAIGGFRQGDFTAYFLSALVVRQLTSAWVVWEMNQELRSGTFSMRLLRPIHPLVAYSAENLAAIPLRGALALPVGVIAFLVTGSGHFGHDPLVWLAVPLSIAGAWLLTFTISCLIGTLGFYTEQSVALFDVYLACFFALSGYLFPLDLLSLQSPAATRVLHALPFYFQIGFSVELMLGMHDRARALAGLAVQWAWVLGLAIVALLVWRRALRLWNAYGA